MSVVFQDQLNQLLVTPGSAPSTVDIATGAAWIQGVYYQSDAINTLTVNTNGGSGIRADLVVLECKWGLDAQITAKVIENPANGTVWPSNDPRHGFPMPPTPVQTYGVKWQVPLAQVNKAPDTGLVFQPTDIIDWRVFVNAGGAKSSTFVVAASNSSALIRANADYVIPFGSVNAEQVINQAILDAAAYGGGTVLLSEGTFTTGSPINLATNVNLKGLGNNSVILSSSLITSVVTGGVLGGTPVSNIVIADLAINGGAPPLVQNTSGNAPANNALGEGIAISEGINITIRNCKIFNCADNGIGIASQDSSGTSSFGARVQSCDISNCAGSGILVQGNSGIYGDNQIYGNGFGIYLMGGGSWGASDNNVCNNIVRDNLADGIVLSATSGQNCTQNIVSGNVVANNGLNSSGSTFADIYLMGTAAYNAVTSNTVQAWNNARLGTGIWIDSGCVNNSISNNECYDGINMRGQTSACPGIAAGGGPTSNSTPNWIRRNHSGLCHCGASDGPSTGYDW